ncbi:unnamed protein product [Nezara viridula]|uniref:Probable glycerol kinase n=1 Tax=Nezara viridula TaxID=85310 RepID=A0A9P0GXM5_NEZVI|nr:unnamed protein product [Nezara viridula]
MSGSGDKTDKPLVGVIDEGTRTIKFAVFDPKTHNEVFKHQIDIVMRTPQEGWAEQDPLEMLNIINECIRKVVNGLPSLGYHSADIVAIGVTNQRETTIVWDSLTGEPLYNALVWSDIRTDSTVDQILAKLPDQDKDYLIPLSGLPVSTYWSALKIRWLIDHVPYVRKAIQEQRCLFGTVDSWIIWNLTGGRNGGVHVTDVTNASRTMLMNIDSLKWDSTLCKIFNIPMETLPKITSSSEIVGTIVEEPLSGIPISGILGNQQSALLGQNCTSEGMAKNTYRSGCFLIYNTGPHRVFSSHGLVTTLSYKLGKAPAVYALEGSVAVAGAAIRFLRDNLSLLSDVSETESLAEEVMTTGDVYFVPAFNGLYAPYWRKDARGILCGLTQFTTKGHIIRAALEAVCFQTRDILEAMKKDCNLPLTKLRVDGRMTANNLLMQLQADLCGIPVVRAPHASDVTTLGAAMAAGWAEGIEVWDKEPERANVIRNSTTFNPVTNNEERNLRYTKWKMAVERSLGWATQKRTIPITEERYRLLASVPGTFYAFTSFVMLIIAREIYSRSNPY